MKKIIMVAMILSFSTNVFSQIQSSSTQRPAESKVKSGSVNTVQGQRSNQSSTSSVVRPNGSTQTAQGYGSQTSQSSQVGTSRNSSTFSRSTIGNSASTRQNQTANQVSTPSVSRPNNGTRASQGYVGQTYQRTPMNTRGNAGSFSRSSASRPMGGRYGSPSKNYSSRPYSRGMRGGRQ